MPDRRSQGFLAIPAAGKGPGLIVLHAWWGLNETIKVLCRRLAAEGYVVFAPDLYRGKVVTTIEEAEGLSRALDAARARADIAEAVTFLGERSDVVGSNFGLIGLSLGAFLAFAHSVEDSDHVRAVVVFYGTGGGDFKRSKAVYLGHFAENDPFEPTADVKSLEDSIRAAGRPVTFHAYEGTGHWFFEPDRSDAYNERAAKLAWERTVAFLKAELPL